MITAKVICSTKIEQGEDVRVTFGPDYADGRNKEWASKTPALSLTMTVKPDVADRFNPGDKFTLTFEPADD